MNPADAAAAANAAAAQAPALAGQLGPAAYTLAFYVFGAIALVLALAVVLSPKLLRAAVYLTGMLITGAAFYVMLGAHFLAAIQVLVYVGGIVVLMVFAIMLTTALGGDEPHPTARRVLWGIVGAAIFFGVAGATMIATKWAPAAQPPRVTADDAKAIGTSLLDYGATGYVLPFEVVSLLLLAVIVVGTVLARRTEAKDGRPAA